MADQEGAEGVCVGEQGGQGVVGEAVVCEV